MTSGGGGGPGPTGRLGICPVTGGTVTVTVTGDGATTGGVTVAATGPAGLGPGDPARTGQPQAQ